MAKFYGKIGYAETIETDPINRPGVWEEQITERNYYGDLTRNTRRLQASSDQLNDNINISNILSIIADPYAIQNFHNMRYVEFQGSKWKVSDIEVQFPRLNLTLGGLYNG